MKLLNKIIDVLAIPVILCAHLAMWFETKKKQREARFDELAKDAAMMRDKDTPLVDLIKLYRKYNKK